MYRNIVVLLCLGLLGSTMLFAQTKVAYAPEKVSMIEQTHINSAVRILEHFSEEESGKKLINLSSYNGNINVPIREMDWRKALDLIALQNGLYVEEGVGYLALKDIADAKPVAPTEDALEKMDPDARKLMEEAMAKQVRIKAIAMLADRGYLKNLGIDWSTVLNGKVKVDAGFAGASQLTSPLTLGGSGSAHVGNYDVDVNTLIRTIENNQKGSILAEPSILVSSGKTGRIQVGQAARVYVDTWPGRGLDGTVARIAPVLDEAARVAKMEVEVENGERLLKPGMFARAMVTLRSSARAQTVPSKAIVNREGESGLFLVSADQKSARYVPVDIGIVSGERTEILSPRLEGRVITLGQHLLQEGSLIILPGAGNGAPGTSPAGN